MDGEYERLQRLYRELGDRQLEELSAEREDLTDEALRALADEMRRRGLSAVEPIAGPSVEAPVSQERSYGFGVGIPGVVPGSEPAVEHALDPGGSTLLGMTALTSFSDGLELSRACAVLSETGVEPAIQEIAGDETTGTAPRFELWVSAADAERSRLLLRAQMGLFPEAETETGFAQEGAFEERVVAQCATRIEADEVMALLRQEGFTPRLEQDALEEGPAEFSVTVPLAEYEQALDRLSARLGAE